MIKSRGKLPTGGDDVDDNNPLSVSLWNACAANRPISNQSTMCNQGSPWRRSEGDRDDNGWPVRPESEDDDEGNTFWAAAEDSDDDAYEVDRAHVGDDGDPDSAKLSDRPELAHHLQYDSSILTLAVGERYLYAGTQDGDILVWSLNSFELVHRVVAHTRAVLDLFLSVDRTLLFSSGGDAIVNAWDPDSLKNVFHIYSTYDVGDVFSVVYSSQFQTVYLGAQNTSIQWCSLKDSSTRPTPSPERHPDRRNHRFFDSAAAGGTSTPRPQTTRPGIKDENIYEIDKAHMMHYAHFGYVYCMLLVRGVSRLVDSEEDILISGGGDGTIKLWKLSDDLSQGIKEIACLGEDDAESVHSMAIDGSFLYSSKLEGVIELWDLDTKQKLRVIRAHKGDILTLQMGWGYLWSAGSTGFSRKYSTVQYGKYKSSSSSFSQKYQCVNRWKAHEGQILASVITSYKERQFYITGSNDNSVSIWNITDCHPESYAKTEVPEDQLIKSLQEFVSFKTISSRPDHAEDCRRGATFLRTLFKKYGAHTEMLNTDNRHNPVVYAKFKGNPATSGKRKKILFYGHYDVVSADDKHGKWIGDPFQLQGVNGYLYGRGVSDNKGPIMAALYGVVDLIHEKKLDTDITFLIEGEEESGSRGFTETVRKHKELIGDIDYILVANSYWLDDEVPCLTYGLRGVLHATVKVDSNHPDVHSGVDGSFMMDEPLFDLTAILAKLKGLHNRIQIPGFYDNILPLTPAEEARYDDITDTLIKRNPDLGPAETLKDSLMARWREPNLTIHRYKVSGPDGSLVSSHASAAISIRLVPNQEIEDVIKSLTSFLSDAFATLDTHNRFSITIDNQADAWLGDPDNEIFRTLEEVIMEVWGPIGESIRQPSVPGNRIKEKEKNSQTPIQSPSLKPSPTTTTTLTQGSDYTSLASSIQQPLPTPTLQEPASEKSVSTTDTQSSIPSRQSSKSSRNSGTQESQSRPTDLSSLPSQKSYNALFPARSSSVAAPSTRSRSTSISNTITARSIGSTTSSSSPARKPLPNLPSESPKEEKPKGRKPLYIREGGSIPGIRFLEKEFDAPAAHLPCGQASDAAHLDNERMRVDNLMKSRIIFGKVFGRLGSR